MKYEIVELTKENLETYIDQVAVLEEKVLENMEKRGQIGQLFITGKEDISEYACSENNMVLIALEQETTDKGINEKVVAASYITKGQKPFTYNDITKYFKYGKEYNEYVKSKYKSETEYRKDLISVYMKKIEAFKYAKEKVLEGYPEYKGDIMKFLEHEMGEENNHFHEKSVLRENINAYMSEYIEEQDKKYPGLEERYEMFYWTTSKEIAQEFKKDGVEPNDADAKAFEKILQNEREEAEYGQILENGPLVIHEKPKFDVKKYFTSRPANTIELDTYITDPHTRKVGLARMLCLDGIKKQMEGHFKNSENSEIFLCSTLHRNNLSSKYVSEFFGLTDSLYVKRRDGRNREVHICKIDRKDYKAYLEHIEKKMKVLYGYDVSELKVSDKEVIEILQEQKKYELTELKRLKSARTEQKFNGHIDFEKSKERKIKTLNNKIKFTQAKLNNSNIIR